MAGTFTAPAVNLRSFLIRLLGSTRPPVYRAHAFDGDSSETVFTLPAGWKPLLVFSDGVEKREGALWHYTQAFDGYAWTVTMDTAPTNYMTIWAVRGEA